jgi:sortase A
MINSSPVLRSLDLRTIERVLFAVGIVLLTWYGLEQLTISFEQRASNRELEDVRMAGPPGPAPAPQAGRQPLVKGALVGRIELPRVGVAAIVREGDDVSVLRRAVGHVPGTALPGDSGNAGLAGHRDTFFRGLRNVRAGDRIIVTTPQSVLQYEVRSMRIVEPTEVSVLAPTPRSTLTLVTCYPFNYIGAAPKRFVVQAELAIGENSGRDAHGLQAQHY